jgi:hypothetical protein
MTVVVAEETTLTSIQGSTAATSTSDPQEVTTAVLMPSFVAAVAA